MRILVTLWLASLVPLGGIAYTLGRMQQRTDFAYFQQLAWWVAALLLIAALGAAWAWALRGRRPLLRYYLGLWHHLAFVITLAAAVVQLSPPVQRLFLAWVKGFLP